ncbi:MAG: hypothetical protein MRY74_08145 [Neomegalonema sp.]|nr:hypothetical protein [Neomegalonema sp.]
MALTRQQIRSYRHPDEDLGFILALCALGPALLILTLVIVALLFSSVFFLLLIAFYIGIFVLAFWIAYRIMKAYYLGNMVRVSEQNFPELLRIIDEKKEFFGFKGAVEAYILPESRYQVFVLPFIRRKYLLFEADVLGQHSDRADVEWVVARHIGALAARHYRLAYIEYVMNGAERIGLLNLLLTPYERAVQYSGDQLGVVAMQGRIDVAMRALAKMMSGADVGQHVNFSGVIAQHLQLKGSIFSWLARCMSSTPHLSYRMANLIRFGRQHFPAETEAMIRNAPADFQQIVSQIR